MQYVHSWVWRNHINLPHGRAARMLGSSVANHRGHGEKQKEIRRKAKIYGDDPN